MDLLSTPLIRHLRDRPLKGERLLIPFSQGQTLMEFVWIQVADGKPRGAIKALQKEQPTLGYTLLPEGILLWQANAQGKRTFIYSGDHNTLEVEREQARMQLGAREIHKTARGLTEGLSPDKFRKDT